MKSNLAAGYVGLRKQAGTTIALRHIRNLIRSYVRDHSLVLREIAHESPARVTEGLAAQPELLRLLGLAERRSIAVLILRDSSDISDDPVLRELVLSRLLHVGCEVVALEPLEEDPRLQTVRGVLSTFLGASDEYDRAMRAHRLQMGRHAKSQDGGYVGGRPPYGLQACNGELVEDNAERQTIELMIELRSAQTSYRSICQILDQLGISARSGSRWQPMTVRRIVERTLRSAAQEEPIAAIQTLKPPQTVQNRASAVSAPPRAS